MAIKLSRKTTKVNMCLRISITVITVKEDLIWQQRIIRRNIAYIAKSNQVIHTFMIGGTTADLCHGHDFFGSKNYRAFKIIQIPALE